ncbi:MAG: OmpA family protein [Crocinitomicaceae bacterium]|nr:OmpA family protein [Crocinitomicaceae bacterium]
MIKPISLGQLKVRHALFSISILTLSSCSQLFFTPGQLNDNGYYVQAERDLAKSKNAEAEQAELLISLFGQHKYKEANELLSGMSQDQLLAEPRTKDIVLNLKRNAGDYSTGDHTSSLHEEQIEQFYTWPANNNAVGEMEMKKAPLMYQNESFTGLHIDAANDKLYMGKKSKKEELGVSHYSVETVGFKNNELVGTWANAIGGAEKSRAYSTSPTIDSKGNLFYSMSMFEGISANPAKMVEWNKESMMNNLGIFTTTVGNSETVTPLPESINKQSCNNTHPHILNDTILFFSSDRREAGNMDVYYSILKSGTWSEPKWLEMNSSYDDVMPISDGKNLYFSSRGHQNFGGLDVFRCALNMAGGEITTGKVENMMRPFNSSSDDMMAAMLTENTGYMATNRNSGGGDEVYYFKLNDADRINSLLLNADNEAAIPGQVMIFMKDEDDNWIVQGRIMTNDSGLIEGIELKKNKAYKLVYSSVGLEEKTLYVSTLDPDDPSVREQEIGELETVMLDWQKSKGVIQDRISDQGLDDVSITSSYDNQSGERITETFKNTDDGNWEFDVKPGTNYKLTFSKDGYEDYTYDATNLEKLKELTLVGMLQESKEGDKINIPNVYFDYNSDELKQESFAIMDNIVSFMNDRPTIKVELGAHSDATGSDYYNKKLSERRAKTCYDYLVSKNISASRLKYKGYGETQLLNRCRNGVTCTDEEHAVNRRMELKVLSE